MYNNYILYLHWIDIKKDGIESIAKSKKMQAMCFKNLK